MQVRSNVRDKICFWEILEEIDRNRIAHVLSKDGLRSVVNFRSRRRRRRRSQQAAAAAASAAAAAATVGWVA